eukprot:Trichotokara_eunicae@DN6201_c0_g1_i8.p1
MPNLIPPVDTLEGALGYKNDLLAVDSRVDFLMLLYLTPKVKKITDEEWSVAKSKFDVFGVKVYPANVTTNSSGGVTNLEDYFLVFEKLQQFNLSLHILKKKKKKK